MPKDVHAHEFEGQTVIIEHVPDKKTGVRKPIGYFLRVRLEPSGIIVANVTSINIFPMPLVPHRLICAEIEIFTGKFEKVTVENPHLSIAAFIDKETIR